MPECRCSALYQWKKRWQNARASSMQPNRSGKSGRYFRVRNCASEYGLSLEVRGREWVFVTPRSASRNATGLDAIEEPLSAWMVNVSRSMCCLVMVSASSFSASRADYPTGTPRHDHITLISLGIL